MIYARAKEFLDFAVNDGSMLRRLQSREEIVEQRVVNSAALGVILHGKSKWVFAQPYLLDDVIMRRPCLHLQVVA